MNRSTSNQHTYAATCAVCDPSLDGRDARIECDLEMVELLLKELGYVVPPYNPINEDIVLAYVDGIVYRFPKYACRHGRIITLGGSRNICATVATALLLEADRAHDEDTIFIAHCLLNLARRPDDSAFADFTRWSHTEKLQ